MMHFLLDLFCQNQSSCSETVALPTFRSLLKEACMMPHNRDLRRVQAVNIVPFVLESCGFDLVHRRLLSLLAALETISLIIYKLCQSCTSEI